ncbi:hypothetical protein BDK51DRAFT_43743, partial [Blyttiomyces helicus]
MATDSRTLSNCAEGQLRGRGVVQKRWEGNLRNGGRNPRLSGRRRETAFLCAAELPPDISRTVAHVVGKHTNHASCHGTGIFRELRLYVVRELVGEAEPWPTATSGGVADVLNLLLTSSIPEEKKPYSIALLVPETPRFPTAPFANWLLPNCGTLPPFKNWSLQNTPEKRKDPPANNTPLQSLSPAAAQRDLHGPHLPEPFFVSSAQMSSSPSSTLTSAVHPHPERPSSSLHPTTTEDDDEQDELERDLLVAWGFEEPGVGDPSAVSQWQPEGGADANEHDDERGDVDDLLDDFYGTEDPADGGDGSSPPRPGGGSTPRARVLQLPTKNVAQLVQRWDGIAEAEAATAGVGVVAAGSAGSASVVEDNPALGSDSAGDDAEEMGTLDPDAQKVSPVRLDLDLGPVGLGLDKFEPPALTGAPVTTVRTFHLPIKKPKYFKSMLENPKMHGIRSDGEESSDVETVDSFFEMYGDDSGDELAGCRAENTAGGGSEDGGVAVENGQPAAPTRPQRRAVPPPGSDGGGGGSFALLLAEARIGNGSKRETPLELNVPPPPTLPPPTALEAAMPMANFVFPASSSAGDPHGSLSSDDEDAARRKERRRVTLMGVLDPNPLPASVNAPETLSGRVYGDPTNLSSFRTPDHAAPVRLKKSIESITRPQLMASSFDFNTVVPLSEVQQRMRERGRLDQSALSDDEKSAGDYTHARKKSAGGSGGNAGTWGSIAGKLSETFRGIRRPSLFEEWTDPDPPPAPPPQSTTP